MINMKAFMQNNDALDAKLEDGVYTVTFGNMLYTEAEGRHKETIEVVLHFINPDRDCTKYMDQRGFEIFLRQLRTQVGKPDDTVDMQKLEQYMSHPVKCWVSRMYDEERKKTYINYNFVEPVNA